MKSDILSEIEIDKIVAFNRDKTLVNAIKKKILEIVYNNGVLRKDCDPQPTRNGALGLAIMAVNGQAVVTNEQLGEDLRAVAQAVALLEQGFAKLEEITSKVPSTPQTPTNNAI